MENEEKYVVIDCTGILVPKRDFNEELTIEVQIGKGNSFNAEFEVVGEMNEGGKIQRTKKESLIKYYVFGQTISREYHDGNFEEVLRLKKSGDGITHIHDPNTETIDDFLVAYDGWMGYAQITEEEYDELEKINP